MPDTPTVWIARHGNRQDFVDPEWRASAARPFDPGLSPDGIEQAQRLAERLAEERIDRIFASPFLRTVQTAHYVADVLDLPVALEPGIGEWLNAAWFPALPEIITSAEITAGFPRVDLTYEPLLRPAYPETEVQSLNRAGEVANRLADRYAGHILLVGHGASVTGAIHGLTGMRITDCALCSLTQIVRRSDGWQMKLCADVAHLGGEEVGADRFN